MPDSPRRFTDQERATYTPDKRCPKCDGPAMVSHWAEDTDNETDTQRRWVPTQYKCANRCYLNTT